jgi:putative transposase
MIFTENIEVHLKEICKDISERYEIDFLEIGVDKNHVHFLILSVPKYSSTKIAQTVKKITAREIFRRVPEVKENLWGGEF